MTDFAAHSARVLARLGGAVTVTPGAGPARDIVAVFSAVPVEALGVQGYGPQLRAQWSDVSDLSVGDPVVVNGATYAVASLPQRDRVAGDVLIALDAA